MSTITDVAKKANVSISTVSRVLNNDETITVMNETRERIIQIAEELKYSTPKKKTTKRKDTTNNYQIGVIMYGSKEDENSDPFFLAIREGVEKQCEESGIAISELIRLRNSTPSSTLHELDGIIVIGKIDPKEIEAVYPKSNHIVYINDSPNPKYYDSIISDLHMAASEVLHHLSSLGHEKIGFLGGYEYVQRFNNNKKKYVQETRREIYEKWMKEKKLYYPDYVFLGDWTTVSGYSQIMAAIKKGNLPTAIFAASDPMAIGALRALNECGIRVPDDMAVASIDDIDIAGFLNPPLTTVKIYTEQMGRTAVNMLLERIHGREVPVKIVFPTSLIIRESCGYVLEKMQ
ncbi:LacI family DNA-binding transcriptional regulator [Alkalihalobacterium bogoriense]|uniref:LacI family DNA-binding transcriptional regulator n=1 Tax=Alkalihalobacterium bogoriense TaxID=246272 RepID=UPI00047A8F54|nr:LacI family DNA-binding transcriptional regulator [Alkalihalobacterium bogoriense]